MLLELWQNHSRTHTIQSNLFQIQAKLLFLNLFFSKTCSFGIKRFCVYLNHSEQSDFVIQNTYEWMNCKIYWIQCKHRKQKDDMDNTQNVYPCTPISTIVIIFCPLSMMCFTNVSIQGSSAAFRTGVPAAKKLLTLSRIGIRTNRKSFNRTSITWRPSTSWHSSVGLTAICTPSVLSSTLCSTTDDQSTRVMAVTGMIKTL